MFRSPHGSIVHKETTNTTAESPELLHQDDRFALSATLPGTLAAAAASSTSRTRLMSEEYAHADLGENPVIGVLERVVRDHTLHELRIGDDHLFVATRARGP